MTKRRGRPAGRKLNLIKTLGMDIDTAGVLTTSAKLAKMSESAYLRHLIQHNAIICPGCGYDACSCDREPLRGVDAVLI